MNKYSKGDNVPDYGEQFTPFSELCRFADEFELQVEIEKPFIEFENLFLKVIHKESGEELERITLDDISSLNEESAKLLNELSKEKKNGRIFKL